MNNITLIAILREKENEEFYDKLFDKNGQPFHTTEWISSFNKDIVSARHERDSARHYAQLEKDAGDKLARQYRASLGEIDGDMSPSKDHRYKWRKAILSAKVGISPLCSLFIINIHS